MRRVVNLLQAWSIPLIVGVFCSLLIANYSKESALLYHILVHEPFMEWSHIPDTLHAEGVHPTHDSALANQPPASRERLGLSEAEAPAPLPSAPAAAVATSASEDHHGPWWHHYFTLHFLVNDIFMVLFFGIATKEIVESCLPGGSLNPPSKAINPLLGTVGGVLGPIGVFLLLTTFFGQEGWSRGWGIPTATDIALAWLVAKFVFGVGHPAISFLLLLAVADDAIGLGIIAFGYPDPNHPTEWAQALWVVPGMTAAFALRKLKVHNWVPYVLIGGGLAWWGLYNAHLHPALALVAIVPFMPAAKRDLGLFDEEADYDQREQDGHHHSTLEQFEHQLKLPVDLGLFFFAFANAGVGFETINGLTWIVFTSLLAGKIIGITGFSYVGTLMGFALPTGMQVRHLFVASIVAGTGLTVALFVAGQAFANGTTEQAAAKMGALFSGGIFVIAVIAGRLLKVKGTAVAVGTTTTDTTLGSADRPVVQA